MGKKLIIKGADFSQNAVSIPEYVELTSMPNGYVAVQGIVEGETNFENLTFVSENNYKRFTTDLDLTNYKYTSKKIVQTRGTGILNVWILDVNNVIIKKMSTGSSYNYIIDEFKITSELYPTAVRIGFCVGVDPNQAAQTILPVLIREHL